MFSTLLMLFVWSVFLLVAVIVAQRTFNWLRLNQDQNQNYFQWSLAWKVLLLASLLPLVPWQSFEQQSQVFSALMPEAWMSALPQATSVNHLIVEHIEQSPSLPWLEILSMLVLSVSGRNVLMLVYRWQQLNKKIATWERLDLQSSELLFLQLEQSQFLVKHKVSVLKSGDAISPMVIGILKPKLVLPSHFFELPIEQQALLIEHEINHLKRRDLVWLWAAHIAVCVLWFAPLFRYLKKQLAFAIEVECDQRVLKHYPTQSRQYGQALITIARNTQSSMFPHAAAFEHQQITELKQRIILSQQPSNLPGSSIMNKMILLLLSGLLIVMSWAVHAHGLTSISVEDFKDLHIHATKQAHKQHDEKVDGQALDGIWVNPVKTASVSSKYKAKERFRKSKPHLGIDLAAPQGDNIVAASRGVVVIADGDSLHRNYGNVVIIDHGEGVISLYAHMETIAVKAGDVVGAGSYLGSVGSTGRSSGPHVHFEVLANKTHIDPASIIEF